METKNQLFKIEGFSKDENPLVLVNGIRLECDKKRSVGFSWGYHGTGTIALAAAIMEKFIPFQNRIEKKGKHTKSTSEFEKLIINFSQQVIVGWGYGDFMVNIDMKYWLRTYAHGNYQGPIIFHHHIVDAGKQ